jgi:hypothetical protein
MMINENDKQVKTLLDLELEEEAKELSLLTSLQEKDYFLYDLVKKYLKLFKFDVCISIANSIKNPKIKEFNFQLILRFYLRGYLGNLLNREIDHNLIQRIKKNLKRINEKVLPKFNQRIKVVNLTLAGQIENAIEIIERIAQKDCYLTVTIIMDVFNLGNPGYRILLEILRRSKNNELKQICYHLFRHQGGTFTKEKIKQYKSETTIIMINGDESYKFQKFKKEDKIIYQRITPWDEYNIPRFVIAGSKILDRESIRQIFLPYSFIVFAKPNNFFLKQIKKDSYLRKIPVIYPENKEDLIPENLKDNFLKIYHPSSTHLEKISGKYLAEFQQQELNQEIIDSKIVEMDKQISAFIEDILTQI